MAHTIAGAPAVECRDRDSLVVAQSERLARLVRTVIDRNPFYTHKLEAAGLGADSLQFPRDLERLPFTSKAELIADQAQSPPWGTALTEPLDRYTRYNQTSSTTGRPLRWLDTPESWQWMLDCWKAVYRAATVTAEDRIFFPFSFGPFLGFWTAFDAGVQLGAHCIPAGGMTTEPRLALIDALRPTVVCCTPTYALRLLDVWRETRGGGLQQSGVRVLIVAGEPGGSIPATRRRIEDGWGARVIDHHGMTEVGPLSFECWDAPGFLHVNESEYVIEVVDAETGAAVPDGQQGELVVTTLGRTASPVVRYRTGDLVVRTVDPCRCGRSFARLVGGVMARADDMVNVRGVNVYPTAIESVLRTFDDVIEYRSMVRSTASLRSLSVEIEVAASASAPSTAARVAAELREALGLAVPVTTVETGTLPRFDMKARRFVVDEPATEEG